MGTEWIEVTEFAPGWQNAASAPADPVFVLPDGHSAMTHGFRARESWSAWRRRMIAGDTKPLRRRVYLAEHRHDGSVVIR